MAFVQHPIRLYRHRVGSPARDAHQVRMSTAENRPQLSRRAVLSGMAAAALIQAGHASFPSDALASVDIDIERFGDKGMNWTSVHFLRSTIMF